MHEETRNWISKANKDLMTAGLALHSIDGPLPVTTTLHCQQSAEKYLKAFLQEHDIHFSSQHHLLSLLESCISLDPSFEILRVQINQLDGYSIASRYPKAENSMQFRNEALNTAKQVKEFILANLIK
jgi:HEPN domain-containing protein